MRKRRGNCNSTSLVTEILADEVAVGVGDAAGADSFFGGTGGGGPGVGTPGGEAVGTWIPGGCRSAKLGRGAGRARGGGAAGAAGGVGGAGGRRGVDAVGVGGRDGRFRRARG